MVSDDIQQQREKIESQIAGKTLGHWLERNAKEHGADPAHSWRDEQGGWQTLSWSEVREQVAEVAMGLASLGVVRGDVVAIMARNRPEHVIADLGALHVGAVPSTFYDTLAIEQIRYVADNCQAKVAVLEGADELRRFQAVLPDLPALTHLVLLDGTAVNDTDDERLLTWDALLARGREALAVNREAFERRWRESTPEDTATLIYTSGTTGPPKGVILTHHNCMFEAISLVQLAGLPAGTTSVSYLPLAHIAERLLSVYIPLQLRIHTYFCPDVKQAIDYVKEARPSFFFGVPRVWEKVRAGITSKMEAEEGLKRTLARKTVAVGRKVVAAEQAGRQPGGMLALQHRLLDHLVGAKIREGVGLDRCVMTASAAAPLPVDVGEFFYALGLPIVEVYGMTETTGVVTGNRPGAVRLGSVGPPLDGVEVKLAEDGEVLARGPDCTPGYLNMPEETAALLDDEGWIHTGDVGSFDDDGFLRIVDRKKELIVTSSGKNISPTHIEGLLKEHPLVGQALAYGDAKPYITALVVLDEEVAPVWAEEHGLGKKSLAELAGLDVVHKEVDAAVASANERLARVEQVKKYTILPTEWTADSEELTPTLKVKRRVVHAKYRDQIESLYGG
jgi:long-chain acyl-CoA synthetase